VRVLEIVARRPLAFAAAAGVGALPTAAAAAPLTAARGMTPASPAAGTAAFASAALATAFTPRPGFTPLAGRPRGPGTGLAGGTGR